MDWQDKLISSYLFICNEYKKHLWAYCERMTNHADMSFSDEEVITIFINGVIDGRGTLKKIYDDALRHLKPWFPKLPSYTAFIQRINKIADVFVPLIEVLQSYFPKNIYSHAHKIIDSMPIVIAKQGRRFNAKSANEIATSNGYCTTKKMYYYGVKLHVVGAYQKGFMPVPMYIGLTNAGVADRKAYEQILPNLSDEVFADKAYQKANQPIFHDGNALLHTPVKKRAKNIRFSRSIIVKCHFQYSSAN